EVPAVGTESNGDRERSARREREQLAARGRLPQSHGSIRPGRGQRPPVGTVGNPMHNATMSKQAQSLRARPPVPDTNRLVVRGTGEILSRGTESECPYHARVALARREQVTGAAVPEPHGGIMAAA